jgi:hypothetical protein
MPFNDATTDETSSIRKKLHAIKIVVDSSTNKLTQKSTNGQHDGCLASRRLNLKLKWQGK